MKLKGKILEINEKTIVFPRETEDLVFKVRAVLDFEKFDDNYPQPEPPEVMQPGGIRSKNAEAPEYIEALNAWAERKTDWMVLKALEATDDLEWETVDMTDPKTWCNYRKELQEAFFAPPEIAHLITVILDVCGLNTEKIEAATQSFLVAKAAAAKESSK
jgi:hypothetical protein